MRLIVIAFIINLLFYCDSKPPPPPPDSYNYVIGTQSLGSSYQFFSNETMLQETCGAIASIGSNIIKYNFEDDINMEVTSRNEFNYNFLVFRSNSKLWYDGLSIQEQEEEYEAVYNLSTELLTTFKNTNRIFFIGISEGDWLLLNSQNPLIQPTSTAITGMIAWLNIRQKAVDDAKSKQPNSSVQVYHYVEVNRVQDALTGYSRVINFVLPFITNAVDYVSYAIEEEVQSQSPNEVTSCLDFVLTKVPPKYGVPGKRVIVGRYGLPQTKTSNNPQEHKRLNLNLLATLIKWAPDFALYYQVYNKEVDSSGHQVGYWLINNKNQKLPLYFAFQTLSQGARQWVNDYISNYHNPPDHQSYLSWLNVQINSLP